MEEAKRRFGFKDFGRLLKNSLQAIFKGEFLLRLKIGRYYIHIAWCVMVMALTIYVSLLIDNTLTKVVANNRIIEAQKTEIATLTYKTSTSTRRSEVAKRLESMGSPLKEPDKPAKKLR